MMLGCGFGRRGIFQDFVRQAVLIAKEAGRPVKLVWTREEDTRHGFYRPVAAARMTAGLDADGKLIAWKIRTSGQSIIAAVSPRVMRFGVDRNFLQGLLEDMPYDVPNYLVDFAMRNTHVPVGVWRSVNHSQNAFFKECFVDEMAHAAGADPYAFRRKLLEKKPQAARRARRRGEERGLGLARRARRFSRHRDSRIRRAAFARRWSRRRSPTTGKCACTVSCRRSTPATWSIR